MMDAQNLVYVVDLDTCKISGVDTQEEGHRGYLTRKGAALFAYHLACEKFNHWAGVKNAAWETYAMERDAVQA